MNEKEMVLEAQNVYGEYTISPTNTVKAVRDVSISISKGEVVGIAGESGCGKSTLVKILYGYLEPPLTAKGNVLIRINNTPSVNILSLNEVYKREKIWWRYMSYIPQNSMNVLNPFMRIGDHFAELLKKHIGLNKEDSYRVAREYVESLGLRKEILKAFPHQLSGGMRQRIVLLLALMLKPSIILADEPTTAVDVVLQKALLMFLLDKQREYGSSLVIVTHDLGVHAMASQRLVVMYAGKVVEEAPTEIIFEDPKHPYSMALIESIPRIGDESPRKGLLGSPPDLRNPPHGCEFHDRCPFAMDICKREPPPKITYEHNHVVRCWLYTKR
jgi:peptide/nickel transport system ATP-binding protein